MDDNLAEQIRAVVSRLSRRLNASAAHEGLTPSQASALAIVVSRGPLGLAQLTAIEGLNPTMLSRIVGRLDELELIRRLPDLDDQRAIRLEATPAGIAAHKRIREFRSAVVAAALDTLDSAQRASITAAVPALDALATALTTDATR